MSPARARIWTARSGAQRINFVHCFYSYVSSVIKYFLSLNIDTEKPFSVKPNRAYVILWSENRLREVFLSFRFAAKASHFRLPQSIFPQLWRSGSFIKVIQAPKLLWFALKRNRSHAWGDWCTFKCTTERIRSLMAREMILLEGYGASAPINRYAKSRKKLSSRN